MICAIVLCSSFINSIACSLFEVPVVLFALNWCMLSLHIADHCIHTASLLFSMQSKTFLCVLSQVELRLDSGDVTAK